MKKLNIGFGVLMLGVLLACNNQKKDLNVDIATQIKEDTSLLFVYNRAKELIATGFNAGTVYQEVWIRDYNTFIEISCDVMPEEIVKENLITFLKFQGDEGDIID